MIDTVSYIYGRKSLSLQAITISTATGQAPTGLIVALHGWGSNAQDLVSIAPFLDLSNFLFLFPNAPLLHPNVPGGRMWYDLRDGYSGLSESRQQLIEWLESLAAGTGVPLSHTVLAGFSQGAAMALDVGLSLPLAGLVALSGYLHPINKSLSGSVPPILIVHGRQDQVVPIKAAQSARDTLTATGATVQYHEFDMSHEIQPAVLGLIRNFVQAVMDAASNQVK
jgi:phospholipase/carboxylesterase